MADNDPRIQTVQHLARQLRRLERDQKQVSSHSAKFLRNKDRLISTGVAPLDVLLPEGGVRPGSLVECLAAGRGSGAGTLIYLIAARMTYPLDAREGEAPAGPETGAKAVRREPHPPGSSTSPTKANKNLVIIDSQQEFYPPAANHLGIDLRHTIVVRPANDDDALWALEQSLRCSGVAVAVSSLGRLDDRVFRRLQLAAETGGGIGLLFRSARFRRQPSWADIRLQVSPRPVSSANAFCRRLHVELVRCRGQSFDAGNFDTGTNTRAKEWKERSRKEGSQGKGEGASLELEIHDETGLVYLVTELASTENPRRANRA